MERGGRGFFLLRPAKRAAGTVDTIADVLAGATGRGSSMESLYLPSEVVTSSLSHELPSLKSTSCRSVATKKARANTLWQH